MQCSFICSPWRGIDGWRRRYTSHKFRCSAKDAESVNADGGGKRANVVLAPFIPQEANEIRDENAVHMLRNLKLCSVQTRLRSEGVDTAHVEFGRKERGEEAPAVLLLHGFDSNCLEFRNLIPYLWNDCHVFVPDLLGWGLTEKPRNIGYGPESRREHLHGYWRSCIKRPVTLVGASLGGAIAIDFAQKYPDAVHKLVLIDAQAYQDRPENPLTRNYPAIARFGAEVLRSNWLRWMAIFLSYEDKTFRNRDVLRMGGLHCRTDGWKEAAVDFIQGEGYCVSDSVKDIEVSTLVVWGLRDRILPVRYAQQFVDDIHRSRLVVLHDAGHSPHLEKGETTARHILDFLDEIEDFGRGIRKHEPAVQQSRHS